MTDRDRIIRYTINWLKRMRVREPTLSDVTVAIVHAKRLNKVWRGRYGIVSPTGMSYRVGLKLYYDVVRELNPAFHKRLLEEGTMRRAVHVPKTKRSREVINEVRGYDVCTPRPKRPKRGRPARTKTLGNEPVDYRGIFGKPEDFD